MSDRRWWSLPKVFAFSLWHNTLDNGGANSPNKAAEKVVAERYYSSDDDDEDIEEFLEKQRNVRLGFSELSTTTTAAAAAVAVAAVRTDSRASNKKLVQQEECTGDRRFARSLSRRRRSRSLSQSSSSASTKYSSFSRASDVENAEKVIKETIYEVTSAAGQISFSFFNDDSKEGYCEDAETTQRDQSTERLYGNVTDPAPPPIDEREKHSESPEANVATESDQPKERHITKLTILLSPARNMEPTAMLAEKTIEPKLYQNAFEDDEMPLYSVIEKRRHSDEKLTQDVLNDLNYVELSEYRRSSSANTAETTTSTTNMEYCNQSAKMKTRLRKISLRRKRKSQPALKKVNIRLSNAWKSIRGWWEEEKAVLKHLRPKSYVVDEDNEKPPDSVSSSEKSFYESIRHLNTVGESQSPELLIDEDGYCSLDLKSDSAPAAPEPMVQAKRTHRRSCVSELSTLRRRLPFPPPRKSNENTFRTSKYFAALGQDGFEELRRYIKQGGDFCKELSVILQERSEAEIQYAKTLSKLSGKLIKASKETVGSVGQAWHKAGIELEATSEVHKTFATALCEDVVKPLKLLFESQHRIRKSVENAVDKTGKSLGEWRVAESKSKKQSFVSARENEKLQDVTLDVRLGGGLTGSNKMTTSSLHLHQRQTNEKESSKLETKRKKAEELVKKSDVEYYTYCVRAERARLEWETAVVSGSKCFQALEEERLQQLKHLIFVYWQHCRDIGPKLTQSAVRLKEPTESCDVDSDIKTIANTKGIEQPASEQLLPDFYAEHTALAMNRERRRQALVKVLQLVVQDLERERRAKNGVENLARAFKQSPNFGNDDSQQNVSEKLHHMRFMLTYLEAARYKISCALSEIDGKPKPSHPLASHIHVIRDRQGFQQSILKVPPWVQKETNIEPAEQIESPNWTDRGTADGNSVQPDSDFDEFSSQSSSEKDFEKNVYSVSPESAVSTPTPSAGSKCRALYHYTANLYDELNLEPGDVINIHDKQPDGWWLGELKGVVGIFPATYVEEIG